MCNIECKLVVTAVVVESMPKMVLWNVSAWIAHFQYTLSWRFLVADLADAPPSPRARYDAWQEETGGEAAAVPPDK